MKKRDHKFKMKIDRKNLPKTLEVKNSTGGFIILWPDDEDIKLFREIRDKLNSSRQIITVNESRTR